MNRTQTALSLAFLVLLCGATCAILAATAGGAYAALGALWLYPIYSFFVAWRAYVRADACT